jgi:hypothetical protein
LADKNAPEDDMWGLGVFYDVEVGVKLKLSLMLVKVSIKKKKNFMDGRSLEKGERKDSADVFGSDLEFDSKLSKQKVEMRPLR